MLIDYSEKINIKNLNILFSLSDFAQSLDDISVIRMKQTHSNQSIFLNQFSKQYEYSDGIFSSNNKLILEITRKFQINKMFNPLPSSITIKESAVHGLGLFAVQKIPKGT